MKKLVAGVIVALLLVAGLSAGVARGVFGAGDQAAGTEKPASPEPDATPASQPAVTSNSGGGMAAMQQAAADEKYLFAFFWRLENEQTAAARKIFEEAVATAADRAVAASIQVTDRAEREIVEKFGVDRAPMPLALAIAPNGAVMGGFPVKFTADDLLGAFSSPSTEKCMKSLQDGKLVFLCVQNASTKSNAEALRGVRDFKADEQYAAFTEIVMLDPADAAEASFLGDLKIDPQTPVAVTAFLAPPGAVIAEFEGATEKDQLAAALQSASSACGPGGACGPSGCGPR